MTAKYLSFSIIIDDIVFPDGREMRGLLGGGGAQTVWGMAAAAESPDEVGIISGLNHDTPAEVLDPLRAAGIDLSGVFRNDLPTPRAWQILAEDGSRRHVWQVKQAICDLQTHPSWERLTHFYPDPAVVHWGIHPEDAYLDICPPLQAHGALISIEPFKGLEQPLNDAALQHLLTQCDIYSPTLSEAISILGTAHTPDMMARIRDNGGKLFALRKGGSGAEIWDVRAGEGVSVPAAPVPTVIDPVGAGDAFCGAFAVTLHRGGSLTDAAVTASATASYMLEQIGMPHGLPDADDFARRQAAVREGVQQIALK